MTIMLSGRRGLVINPISNCQDLRTVSSPLRQPIVNLTAMAKPGRSARDAPRTPIHAHFGPLKGASRG